MTILPAVDIRGGMCVNLVQGDYAQETVFCEDPVAQAVAFKSLGADIVHIVDLDGAKAGELKVAEHLRAMAAAGVRLEVGGGIRDLKTVDAVFEAGAERAILGTAAHRDPEFLRQAALAYPGRIVVGIDAKAGKVALQAWLEVTETDAVDFARKVEALGAARIVYTDILSDGMMSGPNLDATRAVAQAVSIPVTASGGISSLQDIRNLRGLYRDGVDEAIVGRALYLGAFTLPEALAVAKPSF
ncbi:MAG: 1-(5-phosphoribosyl)-5-[(5-phosphoribosylamino)methylideneamino]imidazole-4-carboxamide isomerase [FCB group bacterium]|jgi:phosphoribosylformimino-5-aminoimidazole carboxamide ribotide isomerase|nr:1-(5-phosphoribosyl)-5-[(5-phosphoribosylamino)methylideneamino]imidazole-4-carboxamide isomerase [FCB group bacterium]